MICCFKSSKRSFVLPAHEPTIVPTNYPASYLNMALRITGSFEGSGFNNVAGNFDGQGISAGVLQWNYGQESLQNKILKPYIDKFGVSALDAFFPEPIADSAFMKSKAAVRFAKSKMHTLGGFKIKWAMSWAHFLVAPEVINLQKRAADSVASIAWDYCNEHNMESLKSFCWFFDIVTQNGSLNRVPKPTTENFIKYFNDNNNGRWSTSDFKSEESKILFIWTCKRARMNRWRNDVLSRKCTIAAGRGSVHGKFYSWSNDFE